MPAPDAEWWPLESREGLTDRGYAVLPDGQQYRVNWNKNPHATDPYRVYRIGRPSGLGNERLGTCDTLLEVRAFLLALAYPEGNDGA